MWIKKPLLKNKKHSEENNKKNNRINWIEYKENKILYVDYSNISETEELLYSIDKTNDFILSNEDYQILLLVDTRNSIAKEKIVVDALKNCANNVKPHIKKAAVVGVSKSQEVILTLVNMFSSLGLKPFNSMESAEEWLIK
jgi:hypothetical protein